MIRRLRRHVNATTVIALLAVGLATTGGAAYAAGHFVISSKKQIKPNVLKELKGASGKNGAAGPAGATGPAGPAGPGGPAGKEGSGGPAGATGPAGPAGPAGPSGPAGKEGPAGPLTAFLPKGKTETGVFSMRLEGAGGGNLPATGFGDSSASFPIQLEEPLAGERDVAWFYVKTAQQAGGQPEQCKGTVESPTAAEGVLCLYQGSTRFVGGEGEIHVVNVQRPGPFALEEEKEGAGKAGAVIKLQYEEGESGPAKRVEFEGSWAVTAP